MWHFCKLIVHITDSEDEDSDDNESKLRELAASVPNLNNKSPHNKRRGLSETPEIQRKSRKLFAARTRDIDKLDATSGQDTKSSIRKRRSLTNPRSSIGNVKHC